jgi:two-component system, sensor histidine kinase and response regulator
MRSWAPRSIGARFAWSSIMLILLAGIPWLYFTINQSQERDRKALMDKGSVLLEYLEWTLQFDLELEDGMRIQEQLESMNHIPAMAEVRISSSSGEELAAWKDQKIDPGAKLLTIQRPAKAADGTPLGRLEMDLSTAGIHAAQQLAIIRQVTFMAVAMIVVGIVSTFLGFRVSKRLNRLGKASEALSLGDLDARADEQSVDETGQLAAAFNRMAERISVRERQLDDARIEALELAERARQAEDAKGRFLATMSHEIRTPMNGVLGMANLLLESELDEDQYDLATTLRDSGDSLLAILNDILDYSKIQAGKVDLESIEFDLGDLIEDTAELFAPKANEQRLELRTSVDGELPTLYVGDPGRLRQILANLVGNAIKFTDEGSVQLNVKLDGREEDCDQLRFEVVDTGRGNSKELQQNLFKPFEQTKASTSREFGGTGLGLSICKEFVKLMGGEIGAESEAGKGATFWFRLAMPHCVNQPTRADQKDPVLIVGSRQICQRIGRGKLHRYGIRYLTANCLHEAFQLLKKDGPSISGAVVDYAQVGCSETKVVDTLRRSLGTQPLVLLLPGNHSELEIHGKWSAQLSFPLHSRKLLHVLGCGRMGKAANEISQMQSVADTIRSLDVLVVDDNRVNLKVAERMLKKMGCRPSTVGDGRQALHAVQERAYDLVLMDIQMPIMDGMQALAEIRKLPSASANTPIYMLSALAEPRTVKKAVSIGANGFLTKPFKVEDLGQILQEISARAENNGAAGATA